MYIGLVSSLALASDFYVNYNSEVSIQLAGEWKGAKRTFPSIIPFTASINGFALYIENSRPDCDLTIQIIDGFTGQTVIEEAVPKTDASYIVIPIDALPDGNYTLEIRNVFGGYIYGGFIIE